MNFSTKKEKRSLQEIQRKDRLTYNALIYYLKMHNYLSWQIRLGMKDFFKVQKLPQSVRANGNCIVNDGKCVTYPQHSFQWCPGAPKK